MKEERIFSNDIRINKYKLDDECEHQAAIYFYWADKRAKALTLLSQKEDALKLITAQTDLSLRKNWNEAKYGKSTENSIKAAIESHPNIIEAKKEVNDAQAEVNTLYAAVSAMDHRKDELNNLRALLIGGFYSAPSGTKREGVTEHTQRDIRKKLNKEK